MQRNPSLYRLVSLRSMAVLVAKYGGFVKPGAREIRARTSNEAARKIIQLLLPQSPRGFSVLARLYYLATKTAMLRRLSLSATLTLLLYLAASRVQP